MTPTRDGSAELDRAECLRRLAGAGVGRVSTTVAALPTIFPVHYALLDDNIVFRTVAGTTLANAVQDAVVAFEIDDIDPWSTTGWSIVVVGHAREITRQTRSPAPNDSRSTAGSTGVSPRPSSGCPPRSSTVGPLALPATPSTAERRPDH